MFGKAKNGSLAVVSKELPWKKIIVIVIAIVAVSGGGYFLYSHYFSKEAKSNKTPGGSGGGANNTTGMPPIAKFTASSTHVDVGESITFNASASYDPDGEIIRYDWDFGDSTSQSTEVPVVNHTYGAQGIYQVNLTVRDDQGLSSTATITIHVSPANVTMGPFVEILLSRDNPVFPNSTTFNFTVQRGVETVNITVDMMGLSYESEERKIGNATLQVVLYDPFLRAIFIENYTYRGREEVVIRPDPQSFAIPGEYTLELTCLEGTTQITVTISVNYTPL
ncbi:MAG: PKD domain-containing protein [Thermoplasmata archaeon]|nr:PKD domain-containing protein [Thermoplasmata archaeon]